MEPRVLTATAFIAGLTAGWLAKTWLDTSMPVAVVGNQITPTQNETVSTRASQTENPISLTRDDESFATRDNQENYLDSELDLSNEDSTGIPILVTFNSLLGERRYFDAMVLYQEQIQQNNSASRLKRSLLNELNLLLDTQGNSDFSELIENYLSIYYDDIDILLLLAKFNKSNGSYLEAVDVYLLAKTYAYTDADQRKVDRHFNDFVEEMDSLYTRQKNWWPLINLYSHMDTSGLMNSTYQYRQAIVYLRSGDEGFAVEKLNRLLGDEVVGDSAAIALNTLTDGAVIPEAIPDVISEAASQDTDSIPLLKRGNQYLVELTNNQQSSVSLLIDTGASMTVISIATFNTFNANGDAIEQERRVFQTAGGVVMGTVYLLPELRLGPYSLHNTQVAVIDLDSDRQIDGLLGMNILGQFRFQIDQENARLLLSSK